MFRVLADMGGLDLVATEGTWNLGIGFLAVVAPEVADAATAALRPTASTPGRSVWCATTRAPTESSNRARRASTEARCAWSARTRMPVTRRTERSNPPCAASSAWPGKARSTRRSTTRSCSSSTAGRTPRAWPRRSPAACSTSTRPAAGARGVPHARHARAARRHRSRPRPVRHEGHGLQRRRAQPFYVNAPYGIVLVHNGNLTNTRELTSELFHKDRRHLNTSSDTELLVNILGSELQSEISGPDLDPAQVFRAVARVHERVEGSYATIALIAGYGLLAFRDPFGIRPLILGKRPAGGATAVRNGSWPPSRSCSRTPDSRSSATSSPARPCSSPWTARSTRSSAPRTRRSRRARSSTCTSPAPTP